VLAGIDTTPLDDDERARLAFLRASNMLWALGDPGSAKLLIDDAARTIPPQNRGYLDAFRTVYWFAMDEPATAVAAAEGLALEQLPPIVGAEVAWVLTTVDAEAGRAAAAVRDAETGYRAATRSFDAPHLRCNIGDSHVGALVLAGRIAEAMEVAVRVRQQAATLPGAAELLGPAVAGRAALGACDLTSACELLDRAVTGLRATHSLGWGFRYLVPRVTALAMCGRADEAASALAELEGMPRPFRQLDHEQAVARAWTAASQGVVSEAITLMLAAAERAERLGRFAAEVLCLQTATQFGDRTTADRLRELESVVEGPRVALAARFAAALRDDDAARLSSASADFERMGDLVAALDAAAHAALTHRRHGRRGSALGCATQAAALAEQCGADTPALRRAGERLPLTDREHAIVMLIRDGLSHRNIADRLTESVRTVESHIHRATSKTGTTTRDELGALLARHTGRQTG
jgi:DNA-binding CsgD family transcriptional regulator